MLATSVFRDDLLTAICTVCSFSGLGLSIKVAAKLYL